MSSDLEPDLDDLTRAELGEHEGPASSVAAALDEWIARNHGAGLFLDLLAERGYRVEPIVAPVFADVLPASVD